MSNQEVLVVARLPIRSKELRVQAQEKLSAIKKHTLENEPNTKKYAICIPASEDDGKTLWMLEEYTNQAAFDAHMATPIVKDILAWFGEVSLFGDQAPALRILQYFGAEYRFTKPDVSAHEDPHVVVADSVYTSGGAAKALSYWQAVVDVARKHEPGTLSFGLRREAGKEDVLSTLEVYESSRLRDVHESSDVVAAFVRETESLRTNQEHQVLKVVDGYFHRPG